MEIGDHSAVSLNGCANETAEQTRREDIGRRAFETSKYRALHRFTLHRDIAHQVQHHARIDQRNTTHDAIPGGPDGNNIQLQLADRTAPSQQGANRRVGWREEQRLASVGLIH
eukprot:2520211-Rhodomonas_salina.3